MEVDKIQIDFGKMHDTYLSIRSILEHGVKGKKEVISRPLCSHKLPLMILHIFNGTLED